MSGFVLAGGDGTSFDYQGAVFTMKATGADTDGRVAVMEQECAGPLTVPAHTHPGEDEMFYVLAGELEVFCGDDRWTATTGSFIFLPRDVEHGFEVTSPGGARALTVIGPARFDALVARNGTRRPGA